MNFIKTDMKQEFLVFIILIFMVSPNHRGFPGISTNCGKNSNKMKYKMDVEYK